MIRATADQLPVGFDELQTPCALLDLDRLEHNTTRWAERARRLGVRLRPHVKTHKCVEAARLQVRGHFGGVTVSTLAEVRFFAAAGFDDILYAVPIAPPRVPEAIELASVVNRLGVLVDHGATVAALDRCAADRGARVAVLLKVDCGGGRAGIDPDGDAGVELARRIAASPQLHLRGILTHAGHAYDGRSRDEIESVAAQERDVMVAFADRLRRAGVEVEEVSVGSTPTFAVADDLTGVTEARPGNYAFFDVFQAAIGSCSLEDVAFSVLTTVIGHYPERGELVVDAGALALSKDPGPRHVDPDCGYGVVLSGDGRQRHRGLRVVTLSQEHGLLRADQPSDLDVLEPGSRVRILPNHSCLSAALFDRYHVHRDGGLFDTWRPVRGW